MRTKTRPETTNLMVLCFDPRRASAKSLQSGLPVRRIDRLRPGTNSATILEPTQGRAECRGGLGVTDGDRGTAPPLPESAAAPVLTVQRPLYEIFDDGKVLIECTRIESM